MSSIDFDEVLVHVGEKGKYQNIMYYLLCISATLPAAFLAFSQVSPDRLFRIHAHAYTYTYIYTHVHRASFPPLRFLGSWEL